MPLCTTQTRCTCTVYIMGNLSVHTILDIACWAHTCRLPRDVQHVCLFTCIHCQLLQLHVRTCTYMYH